VFDLSLNRKGRKKRGGKGSEKMRMRRSRRIID
jgi:hypothetical protein